MIQDIDKHIGIINDAIAWAKEYKKDSFPFEQFKEYRRELSKIRKALTGKCSAAAYGESQVGKSYLMSGLLSSADCPFVIENEGVEYSFIDQINPSGGNAIKAESTGLITRFTLSKGDNKNPDKVKALNLSIVDIILLLTDSYYKDVKIRPDSILSYDAINQELEQLAALWNSKTVQHDVICEDDIKDIMDYIKDIIGNNAVSVCQSNFCKVVAPIIQYVPIDKWVDVFSLLWNKNVEINRLFLNLIGAYRKLNFQHEILIPFRAVMREYGTLLKINWLDTVCGGHVDIGADEQYTDVFDREGKPLASNFSKGDLSALIAELTFELPEHLANERHFLRDMDLLDFPGARSRLDIKEGGVAEMLPMMLRRGKVAYLFDKYSRSLQISSVLFCHHGDQTEVKELGGTINSWIEENIGQTPVERAKMLRNTNGVAPLFFVATKFNVDLARAKDDFSHNCDNLDKHWTRFDTILKGIVKEDKWFDNWITSSAGASVPFRNIYPLRDFYWSRKNELFDGYSDGEIKSEETSIHLHADYPDYLDRLKESFVRNKFVIKHFEDPDASWDEFATLNNDGSKAIIRNLDLISGVLDSARRSKYGEKLKLIKQDIISMMNVYYEPEDSEAKNKKVCQIAGDIRRSLMLAVATNPTSFGRIIDDLMVTPEPLRNIAYDIIVCHTDTPKDFSAINLIRAEAQINIEDAREVNIQKLLKYCIFNSEDELDGWCKKAGYDLEELISQKTLTLSSMGEVIAEHLINYWVELLNKRSKAISKKLPHADEVVFMLVSLFKKLNVRESIAKRITRYTEIFKESEQPNAIGDYASLTFNKFVSTVGRHYMSETEIADLQVKADKCQLEVDFTPLGWNATRKPQPLIETLKVFDEAATIINQSKIDISVLRQLPFWNNYQRWVNFLIAGLICSSDISHCDPVCNEKVKTLISRSEELYIA